MAVIQDTLRLNDEYSRVIRDYINNMTRAGRAANSGANSNRLYGNSARNASSQTANLTRSLRSLASAYVAVQGLKSFINLSDSISSITARLNMMNDGLQTTEELNQMIYESAQRSRGSYQQTANLVAKLGTLAGNAFSSNQEIIAFAEQLNKQMALSGTTTQEAQAAMLQLTQGLASGTLRGEELNSVLEQTPMIAQSIAKYMGVNTGEMRELASEGAITADVVKNAMFAAAEDTVDAYGNVVKGVNSLFEEMPMTWAQLFTMAKNMAIQAIQPLLNFVSGIPQKIADNFDMLLPVFSGLAVVVGYLAAQALIMAASFAVANLPLILLVSAVAAFTYGMVEAGATASDVFGVIGQGFGWLYAFVGNIVVTLYNLFASFAEFFANFMNDPIQAVKNLFFDLADTALAVLETIAGAIDFIFGDNLNLQEKVSGWRKDLQNWVTDKVGDNEVQVKRMEQINFKESMEKFGDYGRNIGDTVSNFSFDSLGSGFNYTSSNIASIADSVKGIEKSVSMSEEDIKALVDVAERRYVNNVNLTAQTPVINISGQNTGHTAADRQNLANTIRDILIEQVSSGATRTTARAF